MAGGAVGDSALALLLAVCAEAGPWAALAVWLLWWRRAQGGTDVLTPDYSDCDPVPGRVTPD